MGGKIHSDYLNGGGPGNGIYIYMYYVQFVGVFQVGLTFPGLRGVGMG